MLPPQSLPAPHLAPLHPTVLAMQCHLWSFTVWAIVLLLRLTVPDPL